MGVFLLHLTNLDGDKIMIDLQALSKEDRYNLIRGVLPATYKTKNNKWLFNAKRSLCKLVGIKYEVEIQFLLANAVKCRKYGSVGVSISMDRNFYQIVNKKRKKNKINYDRLKKLISLLDKEDYLLWCKGYWKSENDKIKSHIIFSQQFLQSLDKKLCERWGCKLGDDITVLEVVDLLKSTKSKKVFLPFIMFDGAESVLSEIEKVNSVLSDTLITYKGTQCFIIYKRRFADNLQNAGRWYVVGTFQTESSDGRKTIEIQNTPTVEIDIDRIHPSILASISGFKLPDDYDPYDITDYVHLPIDKKVLRRFCKVAFMALLYAKSRHTALHEIRKHLNKEPEISKHIDAEFILESLEDHNYMLSEYFYKKDNWKLCQYIDGCIATKVMMHFYNQGKVCLNYHDSWIVTYDNKLELIDAIRNSWESVIGNLDNFSYSIEFDNTP